MRAFTSSLMVDIIVFLLANLSVSQGFTPVSTSIIVSSGPTTSRAVSLSALPLPITTDTLGVLGGFSLLTSYHILLYRKEQAGKRTWRSAQADTREQWAKYVRSNQQWLYAIQTLRNAITAQTFLATTVLSLLTVISGRLWDMIRSIPTHTVSRRISVAQFTLVAASMLASGYQFLQSARLMTHAGFMFPVSANTTRVDRIMRKSQNSQWAGLRCLYLSAGFLAWIVGGPNVFFMAAGFLTAFFRKIDRVPEEIKDDPSAL
ncbi:expressed unknown protein [Seminavis robusta]|uniref:DUF599 domain-containing protein n=1 Tax=Seminavis robusta TaxID=568900 RepID=A0A9N8DE31_9STRA|nr:expressed unknown protein [Seminavis robusta]|eukprot:Sro80_g043150.1 n/a (261) ;mRNA; r:71488-72270